jgi:hypothetical protein
MEMLYRYNDTRTRHQFMFRKFQTAKGLKNCLKFVVIDSLLCHDLEKESYLFLHDENPCNVLVNAERFDILSGGYKCTLARNYRCSL